MEKRTRGVPLIFLCCLILGSFWFAPSGVAQEVFESKPNLQPLPVSDPVLVRDASAHIQLRFSTTSWNDGDGQLELIAGERDSASLKQNVYQRVHLTDGNFYDHLAGTFVWHPEHNHFHFEDYATYTLQPFNAPGGSERTGRKTTFCIMDTTRVNTSLPGVLYHLWC